MAANPYSQRVNQEIYHARLLLDRLDAAAEEDAALCIALAKASIQALINAYRGLVAEVLFSSGCEDAAPAMVLELSEKQRSEGYLSALYELESGSGWLAELSAMKEGADALQFRYSATDNRTIASDQSSTPDRVRACLGELQELVGQQRSLYQEW